MTGVGPAGAAATRAGCSGTGASGRALCRGVVRSPQRRSTSTCRRSLSHGGSRVTGGIGCLQDVHAAPGAAAGGPRQRLASAEPAPSMALVPAAAADGGRLGPLRSRPALFRLTRRSRAPSPRRTRAAVEGQLARTGISPAASSLSLGVNETQRRVSCLEPPLTAARLWPRASCSLAVLTAATAKAVIRHQLKGPVGPVSLRCGEGTG